MGILDKLDWHVSFAKNLAHKVGVGDILVNIDCDNFIDDSVTVIDHFFHEDVELCICGVVLAATGHVAALR